MLLHGGSPFFANPIFDRVENHRQSFNGLRGNPNGGWRERIQINTSGLVKLEIPRMPESHDFCGPSVSTSLPAAAPLSEKGESRPPLPLRCRVTPFARERSVGTQFENHASRRQRHPVPG